MSEISAQPLRSTSMFLPVIVIGYGGHGKVVVSALKASGRTVIGVTDLDPERLKRQVNGVEFLTDDIVIKRYRPENVELALGVGSLMPCDRRTPRVKAVEKFLGHGFQFCGFRHPTAWVDPDVRVDHSVQVHAGVIVQPGTVIGAHTILNTGCSVDHDCQIGEFCHVAPGAILSGEVKLGSGSHLGTGCVVIQSIEIGPRCLVAAGATVVRSIKEGLCVRGTPARPFFVRTTQYSSTYP